MAKETQRLDSWKEIADYLGREVRTAIRWENERGLPVRRVPGGMRQSVFAFTSELDAWLITQQGGDAIGTNASSAEANGSSDRRSNSAVAEVARTSQGSTAELEFPIPAVLPSRSPTIGKRPIIVIAVVLSLVPASYFAIKEARNRSAVNEPEMTFTRTDYPASGPAGIVAADFNADGKVDMLVNSRDSNALTVMPGNGDGTFGPRIDSPSIDSPHSFVVGDFNNDGKRDVAVGNQSSRELLIQLGNGDGTFRRAAVLKIPGLWRYAIVGDFNHDGNLDLAASLVNPDSVSIFLGKGDGTFVAKESYRLTTGFNGLVATDINGDGILDIISTNPTDRASGPVSILIGKGDGTFRIDSIAYKNPNGLRTAVGDFNGDGVNDLAVSSIDNKISILLGKSNGLFTHSADLDFGKGLGLIWTTDLNGDGKVDLLLVNCYWDKISIFLGNGNATFEPRIDVPVGNYPYAPAAADFNGDGKIDIAVANYGGDSISVLLNTSKQRSQSAPGKH